MEDKKGFCRGWEGSTLLPSRAMQSPSSCLHLKPVWTQQHLLPCGLCCTEAAAQFPCLSWFSQQFGLIHSWVSGNKLCGQIMITLRNGHVLCICPYSPLIAFCLSDKSSVLTTSGRYPGNRENCQLSTVEIYRGKKITPNKHVKL